MTSPEKSNATTDQEQPTLTCNATYKAIAEPNNWRQLRALVIKNVKTIMRDYTPTLNSVLAPIYFLVILIFISLATNKFSQDFKANPLPYLTDGTCLPTDTPDCVHFAYVNQTAIEPVIEQLDEFFRASEPHPVVMRSYDNLGTLFAHYERQPHALVVAVDFTELEPNVLNASSGGIGNYRIISNYSFIDDDYVGTRFMTGQAYVERALVNVRRSAQGLLPLSSPLPTRNTHVEGNATSTHDFPFITYAPLVGEFQTGTTFLYPYYMLFCFEPVWHTVLTWLSRENESRIRAALFSMGLEPTIYQLSVWLTQAVVSILMSALMVAVIYAGQLFKHTSWSIVFLVFFTFSLTAVGLGLLLAVPFKKVQSSANGVAQISAILFLALFGVVDNLYYDEATPPTEETLTFLLSPLAFGRAIDFISRKEIVFQGVSYSTIGDGPVLAAIYMMIVDAILYALLAFYLDRLYPGLDCHPLPWDFLFRRSFWSKPTSYTRPDGPKKDLAPSSTMKSADGVSHNDLPDNMEHVDLSSIAPEDRGIITIKNLRKSFRGTSFKRFKRKITCKHAVDGLSLQVHRNEIYCLLGHNGAGKTTTLSMLTGALLPDDGDVYIGSYRLPSATQKRRDMDLGALAAAQRIMGVCPQHDILFQHLTVIETLRLYADVKGVIVSRADSAVEEKDAKVHHDAALLESYLQHMLKDVHLQESSNQRVDTLSGGMKRKLSVAIALLGNPLVVLLDEPTTGMDVYTRRQIWRLIQESKQGHTIILTTHSMEEADALGDRIGIMSKGKMQAQGTPLFLKNRFSNGYRLHIEKQRGQTWDGECLQEIVHASFPDATVVSESATEITYQIPVCQVATEHQSINFPALFRQLKDIIQAKQLAVTSIGLTFTTLEEVFIKLQEEEEEETENRST